MSAPAAEPASKRLRSDGPQPPAAADNYECRRYQTPEGCPFGKDCRYRHGPEDTREIFTGSTGEAKGKPCSKFFSTSGCQYGDQCHYSHYVPGGISALGITVRAPQPTSSVTGGESGKPSSQPCRRFFSSGTCRFGDKCHFSHVDTSSGSDFNRQWGSDPYSRGRDPYGGMDAGFGGGAGFPPPGPPRGSFGETTTAKIPIDASLVGAIIGRAGSTIKHIVKVSGAKVGIREHESDSNKKNVEMEGSLEQIDYASRLIRECLAQKNFPGGSFAGDRPAPAGGHGAPMSRHGFNPSAFKTRLCENFMQGTCRFGSKCHFAHGEEDLRKHGDSGAPAPE